MTGFKNDLLQKEFEKRSQETVATTRGDVPIHLSSSVMEAAIRLSSLVMEAAIRLSSLVMEGVIITVVGK